MAGKKKARTTVELCDPPERNFVIDPDGDTIITLKNPGAPFAINPSAAAADTAQSGLSSKPDESTAPTFLVSSRHLILASPVFKKDADGVQLERSEKGARPVQSTPLNGTPRPSPLF